MVYFEQALLFSAIFIGFTGYWETRNVILKLDLVGTTWWLNHLLLRNSRCRRESIFWCILPSGIMQLFTTLRWVGQLQRSAFYLSHELVSLMTVTRKASTKIDAQTQKASYKFPASEDGVSISHQRAKIYRLILDHHTFYHWTTLNDIAISRDITEDTRLQL